ncbi:double-stranded RNA-specific editase Adar-like [Calliphora vicina]|uniref:double-stranded RNA-specific editase Adar-like n=1 Tax=Calliphora vicina TaxID=7373 RepID=UPI00325B86F9
MDCVDEGVEMKVCVRSFAKNPIEKEDSNSMIIEESVNKTQKITSVNHPKPAQKRPRDDNEILFEEPLAKRRPTNECKTVREILKKSAATSVRPRSQPNVNSAMTLKSLYPNLNFTLEAEVGSAVVPYYMMSAMVGGRKFFGHGKTKQLAEKDAALQILKHLKNLPTKITKNFFKSQTTSEPKFQQMVFQTDATTNREISSLQLPSHLADIVESKIMQKFDELTRGRQEIREYKVVAGIVMTFDMNFEQAHVVSIATGTKCVNGGNICCNGSVLNDSHAEIIAKRGLMNFLYTQLRWHCEPNSARISIFHSNPYGLQIPYSLKPNVHFHLYINTAPCGDARIFSMHDYNRLNNMATTSFNSGQCGQLRTKVEGDIGTTPVGTRYHSQTWDGVILGEPLLTMSCSDKITRWNVVGIQGALLSQLVEPIYLHSIVLGSMFSAQHMYRATCGRIQHTLGYLPQPYRLNRPLLGQTSTRLPRNTYRVPSIGINWTLGDNDIEIISLPTGRIIYNETSCLSKQAFFYKFNYLLNNLPNIGGAYMSNNYAEAKENSRDFQMAKTELLSAFYRANLGSWVKKPIEQNEFTMNLN